MSFAQLFCGEIKNPRATRRSIAICYALLISKVAYERSTGGHQDYNWQSYNTLIMDRFGGMRGLEAVKRMAWEINDAAASVNEVA